MAFGVFPVVILCSIFGIIHNHMCKIEGTVANCSKMGLKFIPRDLPRNVTTLNMRYNEINILTKNSFLNYAQLLNVNMEYNRLREIELDAFAGMNKLINLSMSDNELDLSVSYQGRVFNFLTSLEKLDIRRNTESKLSDRLIYPYFGNLSTLKHLYLDLSKNPDFNQSGLQNLRMLKVLRFENCYIYKMTNKTFLKFPDSVQEIYFSSYKIILPLTKVIELDFLKPFSNLQILSFNNIQSDLGAILRILYPLRNKSMKAIIYRKVRIDYGMAVILTNKMTEYLATICVNTLVLADLDIVDIGPGSLLSFKNPSCLENIVLTGNRFALTETHNLAYLIPLLLKLTNLKVFDYSYNPIKFLRIQYIPVPYFDNSVSELLHIDSNSKNIPPELYNNEILQKSTKVITNDFGTMNNATYSYKNYNETLKGKATITLSLPCKLHTLRLSHFMNNGIYRNHKFIIKNITNLRHLDISYYQIQTFKGIVINSTCNLQHLDISGISSRLWVEDTNLPFLKSVKYVIMKDANLGQYILESNIIGNNLPSIEMLDISYNSIWIMDEYLFLNNTHLKTLIILGNLFLEIPIALTHIKTLEHLDIRHNQIQSVNRTMGSWIDGQNERNKNGFSLELSGNVFQCNCDTTDFIKWLFQTKAKLDFENRNYSCRLSNGSRSDTLSVYREFHDLFNHCDSSTWLKIGMGCLFTLIIITIIAAVLFNFRWKISYWIYKRFKEVVREEIHRTFMYDIYLSYAADSVYWIKNELVPTIEKSWKMKICIEDRDFIAGELLADTISTAIQKSRYIIFVVTEEFKKREWRFFELERAKFEKYTNNLQKIVVIVKNVPSNDFPQEFYKIWKDISIIEWSAPGDTNGWNELRMTLFPESI